MAVSLNVPNTANLRSDYAISDAAMAQRNFDAAAQADQQQSSKFEEMLAQFDGKSEKFREVQQAIDEGKYDVPTLEELEKAGIIYIDKDTGRVMPENPRDLAVKVLKGELDVENLPIELLTPEFLQAISHFSENASEKIPEEFFPTEEPVKNDFSKQIQDSGVLAELAQLIKAMTGETAENAEFVEVTEQIAVTEVAAVQTELISDTPKNAEPKPQTSETGRFDAFVQSDEAEIPAAFAQNTDNSHNSADFGQQSGTQGEIPEELKNLGEEKLNALQKAVSEGEISKVEVKTTEVEQTKPVSESEKVPEKAEQTAEIPELRQRAEGVKTTVSEELEMLKNAKAKPVSEQTNAPVNAQNPLNADSPIVFKREDGEVSVRPSEIVSQAMKAVQTAVSENKEQTEYSLVLNPEELGRITVKMTKTADGAVSVTIAAENARTQRVLEQHSELMQSNLKDSGINLESWQTVRESQQEAYAQDYNGSSKNPYFTQQSQNDDEDDSEKSFADIIAAM